MDINNMKQSRKTIIYGIILYYIIYSYYMILYYINNMSIELKCTLT